MHVLFSVYCESDSVHAVSPYKAHHKNLDCDTPRAPKAVRFCDTVQRNPASHVKGRYEQQAYGTTAGTVCAWERRKPNSFPVGFSPASQAKAQRHGSIPAIHPRCAWDWQGCDEDRQHPHTPISEKEDHFLDGQRRRNPGFQKGLSPALMYATVRCAQTSLCLIPNLQQTGRLFTRTRKMERPTCMRVCVCAQVCVCVCL